MVAIMANDELKKLNTQRKKDKDDLNVSIVDNPAENPQDCSGGVLEATKEDTSNCTLPADLKSKIKLLEIDNCFDSVCVK